MFFRSALILLFSLLLAPQGSQAALVAYSESGSFRLHGSSGEKRLSSLTWTGKQRGLLVLRQREGWLGVRGPWRPSRAIFWTKRDSVATVRVREKIEGM